MEPSLLTRRTARKATKKKTRTSNRPGLWRIHFGIGYALAAFVLFQFISVQIAVGFYENPAVQIPSKNVTVTQAVIKIVKPVPKVEQASGLPIRLKIPRIRVDSLIRNVGLLPGGSMGVPKRPQDTAWYMLGPKPGEVGSAVIAGHLNWWSGALGVFRDLNKLRPGDKITTQDDKGNITTFVVRKSKTYGQKADASDVFYSYDGESHLNLVTCSGIWNKISKTYTTRLVVFADKVE